MIFIRNQYHYATISNMKIFLIFLAISFLALLGFMLYLAVGFYFNNHAGKPIDPEKSGGYCWGKFDKQKIYFASGGMSSVEIVGADIETFLVVNDLYAKDKNHIYFEGRQMIGVDVNTFYIDDSVVKDDKQVYFLPWGYDEDILVVEGADPLTYKRLAEYSSWGKDHAHYYFGSFKLDVDFDTFTFLGSAWAKDVNHLYRLTSEGVEIIDAHIDAIELISDDVVRDDERVFFNGYMQGDDDPEGSQLNSFKYNSNVPLEILSDAHIRHDGRIYYYGLPTDIDAESFRAFTHEGKRLLCGYSKDKNHVYLHNKKLESIDAATFTYDHNDNFVDKNNHYDTRGNVITPLGISHE